ncbi:ENTH/VHS/GAT family protein [Dorcoceras hygrometricum]|uniref:ENTH/VHS/GAT family protein n=1 Tax=Dorcoceras hygrometricum TaxID=472368 RepID=A0A2Z7D8G6_9LAMI|nr:ENTH/VHS/GAT family protein [Dorcoceras hygrometricum]
MGLWRRASGILKDQNSLWLTNLSRQTALRNPDIEYLIIKSTSHNESSFDSRSIERVCRWIRLSPINLKPLLWSISNRLEKTKSWVVALKGMYLMHNVINCMAPCIKEIGRLPFDLSNFKDLHSRQAKTWSYNSFIRNYYAFLDQKSTLIFQHMEEKRESMTMKQELVFLQKLQSLVDLLIQIKPQSRAVFNPLVLDAMDAIIMEVSDIYSRICKGIAIVLINIYSANKDEAVMALKVVQKATLQADELSLYFDFCQEIMVLKASESPLIDKVPEEGIQELKNIVNGFSEESEADQGLRKEDNKAIVVAENSKADYNEKTCLRDEFRTIITDQWEKFEEDIMQKNPFASPLNTQSNVKVDHGFPDLITF